MDILQAARQGVFLLWDGNEMDVVGHQAIADQRHPVSLDAPMKQIEVNTFLGIPFQDEAPRIAALRDVMSNAWRNHPGESNHLSPRRTTFGAPGASLPINFLAPAPGIMFGEMG